MIRILYFIAGLALIIVDFFHVSFLLGGPNIDAILWVIYLMWAALLFSLGFAFIALGLGELKRNKFTDRSIVLLFLSFVFWGVFLSDSYAGLWRDWFGVGGEGDWLSPVMFVVFPGLVMLVLSFGALLFGLVSRTTKEIVSSAKNI